MSENKCCIECGKVLPLEVTECPNCGCPVDTGEKQNTNEDSVKEICDTQIDMGTENLKQDNEIGEDEKNDRVKLLCNRKRIVPYISLIIGIIVLIMGIVVSTKKADINVYTAENYDVSGIEFGADFYTEIYNASDTIVGELNAINGGMESLSKSLNSVIDAVYFSAGMIIIALGLCTIAVSCVYLKKENY